MSHDEPIFPARRGPPPATGPQPWGSWRPGPVGPPAIGPGRVLLIGLLIGLVTVVLFVAVVILPHLRGPSDLEANGFQPPVGATSEGVDMSPADQGGTGLATWRDDVIPGTPLSVSIVLHNRSSHPLTVTGIGDGGGYWRSDGVAGAPVAISPGGRQQVTLLGHAAGCEGSAPGIVGFGGSMSGTPSMVGTGSRGSTSTASSTSRPSTTRPVRAEGGIEVAGSHP